MAPEPPDSSPETSPDEEARRARAARLHAQIERVRSVAPPAPAADEEESPRDRIARRMRELDEPADDDQSTVDDDG